MLRTSTSKARTLPRDLARVAAVAGILAPCIAAVAADPASASAETDSAISNGDGLLSVDELHALSAADPSSLRAVDVADVREGDLERLPPKLVALIQAPVAVGSAPAAPLATPAEPAAKVNTATGSHHWWTENAFGWHLGDYHLAVSWGYDGSKVYDPSSWTWGDGHWGYQYCSEDARGERWVTARHTVWQAFGRGKFGPPGCDLTAFTNGGTVNVSRLGNYWPS